MNDLMKTEETGKDLIIAMPEYRAFDDEIDQLPLIFPYLRVGQKDQFPGQIYDGSTGQGAESITACLVKITSSRAKWHKPFKKENKYPLCRSNDSKTPDINLFLSGKAEGRPPADACKDCPDSKTNSGNGEWTRPRCDQQIVLWGIDTAMFSPFILTLTGLSLSSKSQTKGFMSIKQVISHVKLRRMPLYMFRVILSAGKATGEAGDAYACLCKMDGIFGKDELEKMTETIRLLVSSKADIIGDSADEAAEA